MERSLPASRPSCSPSLPTCSQFLRLCKDLHNAIRGSSSNGAKIYSKDPVFGFLGVKNRSQTAKTREHCVKYMREIRIDQKFCSCRAVFHAVNGPSIVGVGPVWRNY